MRTIIDINCDLGEGMSHDAEIMPYITSANIACGFHAGDEETIRQTIDLCIRHHVNIGAHPSYPDRDNFGRKSMPLPEDELYRIVQQQIQLIITAANDAGATVRHVKPHGALYHMAAHDESIADIIISSVKDLDARLVIIGLSGSHLISAGRRLGMSVAQEVFADRTYLDDGRLTPRSEAGALHADVHDAVAQSRQMIREGTVTTLSGKHIPVEADTICLHGDGAFAVDLAKALYQELQSGQ